MSTALHHRNVQLKICRQTYSINKMCYLNEQIFKLLSPIACAVPPKVLFRLTVLSYSLTIISFLPHFLRNFTLF